MEDKIRLILCDLDGTLLHSDKTISDYSVQVLTKCKEKGILVGFATSRGRNTVIPYEKQINPDLIICNGGASVVYKNEIIYTRTFSLDETRTILSQSYSACGENAEITLDTLDNLYWNRLHDKSTSFYPDSIYDDFRDFKIPAMKICLQTQSEEAVKIISQSVKNCDALPFSDIPWYKFSNKEATKENAIKFLCSYLGFECSDIIAFGDDFNDMGMLKLCGKGIAMQNAISQVKEISDDIALSNDSDGVAEYLKKVLSL